VIAYFTKEIALVFPVALLGYYFLLNFFPRERTKEARRTSLLRLLLLGIMILAAVGLYLWSNTNSQYYQLGFDSAFFATHWKYFLFGILFYVIVSMIALFVFPVIFPGILWKELEEREKKWYLFLLLLVLVTAAVVSYTIYIYEDYPSMTPKAHVRYVEYLTAPFLILLFSLLEKNKIPSLRWWQWGMIGGICLIEIVTFRGFFGWTVDQTALFYLQLLSEDGHNFVRWKILVFSLVMTAIILFLSYLFSKHRQRFAQMFVLGVAILSLGNTALSTYIQYKTHSHPAAQVTEMESLREFVQQHEEDNFLVLSSHDGWEMMDSYLMDCDNVLTADENISWYQGENGIDLSKDAVATRLDVQWKSYDVKSITYIITDDAIFALEDGAEPVEQMENLGCTLWKLEDGTKVPVVEVID
jgi:hypothetical protein